MAPITFLSVEDILQIQEDTMRHEGGLAGLRDPKLLESAVTAPPLASSPAARPCTIQHRHWAHREESMAEKRRRVVMSRVLRGGKRDDGSFDRAFWQKVGPAGIFAAAWEMVAEAEVMRGGDGDQSRLRRDVLRVVRRGR